MATTARKSPEQIATQVADKVIRETADKIGPAVAGSGMAGAWRRSIIEAVGLDRAQRPTTAATSDRYDEARKVLAEYDEHTEPRSISDQRHREYRLASALRALIEPPTVEDSPDLHDLYSRAHRRALPNENGPYTTADLDRAGSAALEAVYQAGIQAAWKLTLPLHDTTPEAQKEA